MSDAADIANELAEIERAAAIQRRGPYRLDAGRAGECEDCGRQAARLVGGLCAPCRDFREHRKRG